MLFAYIFPLETVCVRTRVCMCVDTHIQIRKALTLYTHKYTFSESPVIFRGIFSLSYGSRAGKRFCSIPVSMHFPAPETLAKVGPSSPFPGVKRITSSHQGSPKYLRVGGGKPASSRRPAGGESRLRSLLVYWLMKEQINK